MASVYQRGDRWYVRYKDARGKWRSTASAARTKTEAKRLAGELERKCERQRLGLEELPPADGGGTFGELMLWWVRSCQKGAPWRMRTEGSVRRNLVESALGPLLLVEVTPARIEEVLDGCTPRLSASSVNHLRSYVSSAFERARRAGRWSGPNPAGAVPRRKVPKRKPDFLRAHEVPQVLAALSPKHRPLFAAAIYTALRKGELAGLRRSDIDFSTGLITVRRSYARDVPKGGAEDVVPIARELVPYLETALESSPNELVFPGPDGEMMSPYAPLEEVLRRALGRAGIVEHYLHVCRKKGCGYAEQAPDAALRRCPEHAYRLWPKAKVRKIRFHDLRHTTGSLLLMSGASPAAVQRVLRHSDPRMTTEVYGHLLPGYLRDEIDRLRFGSGSQDVAALPSPLVTSLLQVPAANADRGDPGGGEATEIASLSSVGHEGLEPSANGLRDGTPASAASRTPSQTAGILHEPDRAPVHPSHRRAAVRKDLVTTLLQAAALPTAGAPSAGQGSEGSHGAPRLLTVKEAAAILRVSAATVYAMVARGELEHARVSNAIRIVVRGEPARQELHEVDRAPEGQ